MHSLLWLLVTIYCLIILLWMRGHQWVRSLHTDRAMRLLPDPHARPDPAAPSLTVIIAAHNEQRRIGPCLNRLLAQNYAPLRVLIVDDRSDDRTSDRVREAMANDERIDLLRINHLPDGWIGKTHALQFATEYLAAANLTPDYLLFMDCDCRLVDGAIAAVMKKVLAEKFEFVSLWPGLDLRSAPERILTPVASWILGLFALLDARRGSPQSDVRLGNGQFMLFSKSAYQKVGTHAAVRAELAEDAVLAARIAELNLPHWAGLGKHLYTTTRTNNLASTVDSLTRVLIGSLISPLRLFTATQLLLGGIILPLWLFPLCLYLGTLRGLMGFPFVSADSLASLLSAPASAYGFIALACILHFLLILDTVRRLHAMTLRHPPNPLAFFIGAFLCLGLLARALLITTGHGSLRWGKTTYRVQGSRIIAILPTPAA